MGKFFRRIAAVLLAACMVLSFAACKDDEDGTQGTGDKGKDTSKTASVLKLPYSREDGINPFTASSLINNPVVPLIYSGLYTVDAAYKPDPELASGAEFSGEKINVTLGSSKKFSDGTPITGDDVVYSFNKAKESVYYASSLVNIVSVSAANSKTVVFTVSCANEYALACLTFPIVKENSANSAQAEPIGAGKYTYKNITGGAELVRNRYYSRDPYTMDKIRLVNITDNDSLIYSLVIGNFDAHFDDLAGGESQRINASVMQVQLNNLVYAGINPRGRLADEKVRQYISGLINRDDLISSGLEGYGTSSVLPFNPQWYEAENLVLPKYNKDEAKEYLKSELSRTPLNILVNSDNNFKVKLAEKLCSQLKEAGVSATLTKVPFAQFTSAVASGHYDIYIGEYKLTNDMDISALINDEELLSQYREMLAGNITCSDFMTLFYEKQPFIPIGFRTGVLIYSRMIDTEIVPMPGNPYANINDWFI